jgi:hypothetical protein
MQGPKDQYTRELLKMFGYHATWFPQNRLDLGAVGVIEDGLFTRLTDLKALGIPFDILPDDTPADLEYSSSGSVTISTKASGTASIPGSSLADGDAGVVVEFNKEKATYFRAMATRTPSIADTNSVGKAALDMYKQGKWEKNWAVVTELVVADSATVIISNTNNGKVELKANANVKAATIDIADASLQFGIQFSRGLETKVIAEKGMTPLYRVMGIKTNIFTKPDFKARGIRGLHMVTPAKAKGELKDKLFFGYLSEEVDE